MDTDAESTKENQSEELNSSKQLGIFLKNSFLRIIGYLKRLYAFFSFDGEKWGKRLVKISLALIFFSLIYSAISFWLIPEPYEYPGEGNGTYPSSAYIDFLENRTRFNTRLKASIYLHLATIGPLGVLYWMLQTVAISGTYIMLLKILKIIDKLDPEKPPVAYINLAVGSVLVGIIILTSSTKALGVTSRLINVITIALLVLIVWGLEKIRKGMIEEKADGGE